MRSSRLAKVKNKKSYLRSVLLTFFVIIPCTAIICSIGIYLAANKDRGLHIPIPAMSPNEPSINAFKYNFDIEAHELYRIEFSKFDEYDKAEALIAELHKKKLNGFIIKEQGYVVTYGLFWNRSQAEAAMDFIKRKKLDAAIVEIKVLGTSIRYDDVDKNLIDITSAVHAAVLKIISEKSALSLESLYTDKQITSESLAAAAEKEAQLNKYLNYLKTINTSEVNVAYRTNLELLINEVLVDRIREEDSYDYYKLQNSLMNQGEALRQFFEKSKI